MSMILRLSLVLVLPWLTACDWDWGSEKSRRDQDPIVQEGPDYWPTSAWQSVDPVLQGFAANALDALAEDAEAALPGLTSLMIIRNGYVVHESYHTPEGSAEEIGPETKHNVWSVTKSVSSLTTGAALQNGLITVSDLDLTTNDFFADMMASYEADDGRRDIRFRDVLQMRSGLSWSEAKELITFTVFHIYLPDPSCSDDDTLTICSLLRRPLAHAPGTVWNYNTYDSYLLSAFFYHLTDYSLSDYARQFLLAPIGITLTEEDWAYWPSTETNNRYTYGGGFSQYRTQDIARIGMLVLHRGQWDGQQLVAPEWFDLSLEPIGEGSVMQFDGTGNALPEPAAADISYGMQWWTRTGPSFSGPESITARGLGGQYLMIFPEHDLIAVATHAYELGETVPDRTTGFVDFLQSQVIDQIVD